MNEEYDLSPAERFTHCRVCGSRQFPRPRGARWHNLEIDEAAGEVLWHGCKVAGT